MLLNIRPYLLLLLIFPAMVQAQPGSCFLFEDMEGDEPPAGWDIGPWVERVSADGQPLGEFVPAWTVGTAAQAGVGGYFNVPDVPVGNRAIMVNDDAPPCPCDLSEVTLTLPSLDLTDRNNVALEFRVYHDMLLGGGEAYVEASLNGTDWYLLHTIPALENEWQHQVVDLSDESGAPQLYLRFRWSDNGEWATGIALDDLCLRERFDHDLGVMQVFNGDPTVPPFITGDRSLDYTKIPLEQAAPIIASAEVMNRGTQPMTGVSVAFMIEQNGSAHGPFNSGTMEALAPGERHVFTVGTDWTPASPGATTITATVGSAVTDEGPGDNMGSREIMITAPGWENGLSAMALDDDVVQGAIGGTVTFVAGARFELVSPAIIPGMSFIPAPGTEPGGEIRGILFDMNFSVVDTTERLLLTADDLSAPGGIYLPFHNTTERPAADHYAGIQKLSGTGPVLIGVSGNAAIGSAFNMQGGTFTLGYPEVMPMVRLHFSDAGVGVPALVDEGPYLRLRPNPATGRGWIDLELEAAGEVEFTIHDPLGRIAYHEQLGVRGAGMYSIELPIARLVPGLHPILIRCGDRIFSEILVVEE